MKIAIHQPHYFPWIGYLDKMAKVDAFVILDEVQFEKGSQMIRNRVLDENGNIKFLTMSGNTKNFLEKKYSEIETKNVKEWTTRQLNALQNYYRRSENFKEVYPVVEEFLHREYSTICQWSCESIKLKKELLKIETPLIFQSDVEYDRKNKKSDLVYAICNALNAEIYLSGRGGSMEYLDREKFLEHHIKIVFQDFEHPVYKQIHSGDFVPGISILDMLFNCGIEETRRIFWENVKSTHEFDE